MVEGLTADAHDLITDKKYDHLAALVEKHVIICGGASYKKANETMTIFAHATHTASMVYIYI